MDLDKRDNTFYPGNENNPAREPVPTIRIAGRKHNAAMVNPPKPGMKTLYGTNRVPTPPLPPIQRIESMPLKDIVEEFLDRTEASVAEYKDDKPYIVGAKRRVGLKELIDEVIKGFHEPINKLVIVRKDDVVRLEQNIIELEQETAKANEDAAYAASVNAQLQQQNENLKKDRDRILGRKGKAQRKEENYTKDDLETAQKDLWNAQGEIEDLRAEIERLRQRDRTPPPRQRYHRINEDEHADFGGLVGDIRGEVYDMRAEGRSRGPRTSIEGENVRGRGRRASVESVVENEYEE